MTGSTAPRLERSCGDYIRVAPAPPGLERAEAHFTGRAFAPHRHDTYAVGVTLAGVQAFRYRGAARRSLPGEIFVLHPDELHDGCAGTPAGFRYRILYVAPALIGEALGGGALPFVRDVVSQDRRLAAAIGPALADLDTPLDALERGRVLLDLAEALVAADASIVRRPLSARGRRAVARACELLTDADAGHAVTSAELEAATGVSRYTLARQFRACLGTSPDRYRALRRLDRARALIAAGTSLAEAAAACSFADQSHMTRRFRQAYGLPPGRWAALTA